MACSLAACGPEPLIPPDWERTYSQVRDCRRSGDHDLSYVLIYADPLALLPYQQRAAPFPDGGVLLKAEYAQSGCVDLTGYTVMKRVAGFAGSAGDWRWQRLSSSRAVVEDGALPRCQGCHASCGVAPDGHDWTCAAP